MNGDLPAWWASMLDGKTHRLNVVDDGYERRVYVNGLLDHVETGPQRWDRPEDWIGQ